MQISRKRHNAKLSKQYFFSLESSGKALFQTENFYWKIHLRDIKSWIQHTLVHQLSGKTPFMMTHPLVRAWKGVRHRVSDSVFSVSSYILVLRLRYIQGDQNCCLGVSHIKTTPFVQKKSCWLPQDTQGH